MTTLNEFTVIGGATSVVFFSSTTVLRGDA